MSKVSSQIQGSVLMKFVVNSMGIRLNILPLIVGMELYGVHDYNIPIRENEID